MKLPVKILIISFSIIANIKITTGQSDTTATLNLRMCINAALGFSPVIKEGFAKTVIKSAEIASAKSSQYPYLSTTASYYLTNQNKLGNNYNTISYDINANLLIWQYGRNKAIAEQSELLYQAELSGYNALQQDVIFRIKLFYFEYLKYLKLLAIARSNAEQTDLFLNAAKEKRAIGIGKNSDIFKAESDVADAKYIYTIYENNILKASNELVRLTGLNINGNTKVQDELFTPDIEFSNIGKDTLFSVAKNNYPELKRMEDLLLYQKAYLKSIKADRFPKISAGAGYNLYYDPAFVNSDFWNAGLTISWDIFNGYRKNSQVKIEKIQGQALLFQKEELWLNISKEINNQYLAYHESYIQIGIIETLLKSTNENLNIIMEEYEQGISSMLELSNARVDNFRAKEKYVNAWYMYQVSKVQMERTLGVTK